MINTTDTPLSSRAWANALAATRRARADLADETSSRQHTAEYLEAALSELMVALATEGLAPRSTED